MQRRGDLSSNRQVVGGAELFREALCLLTFSNTRRRRRALMNSSMLIRSRCSKSRLWVRWIALEVTCRGGRGKMEHAALHTSNAATAMPVGSGGLVQLAGPLTKIGVGGSTASRRHHSRLGSCPRIRTSTCGLELPLRRSRGGMYLDEHASQLFRRCRVCMQARPTGSNDDPGSVDLLSAGLLL